MESYIFKNYENDFNNNNFIQKRIFSNCIYSPSGKISDFLVEVHRLDGSIFYLFNPKYSDLQFIDKNSNIHNDLLLIKENDLINNFDRINLDHNEESLISHSYNKFSDDNVVMTDINNNNNNNTYDSE